MSLSPFDHMKIINSKSMYPSEDDMKGYSQWMVNKICSCDPQYAMVAGEINRQNITDKMNFDLYYFGLPSAPKKFIKYLAKKEKEEKTITYIREFYQCSQQQAKDYLVLLSKEELTMVVDYFEKRGTSK